MSLRRGRVDEGDSIGSRFASHVRGYVAGSGWIAPMQS